MCGIYPVLAALRAPARQTLLDAWRVSLEETGAVVRRVETVLPNWGVWLDGIRLPLT